MIISTPLKSIFAIAKKFLLVLLSIHLQLCITSQQHPFNHYPLQGKIKSVEVSEITGYSFDTGEKVVETVQYDNKGRQILKQRFERSDRVYTEKSIYSDNRITTYKCYCKDTEELETKFNPQPSLEPKNETNYGWLSGDNGSSRPKIEVQTLDKKGNCIEMKEYAKDGSMNFLKKMTYNNKNLLLRSEQYYYLNELDTYETFEYDANGNCVDDFRNDISSSESFRIQKQFDSQNRVIKLTDGYNGKVARTVEYRYVRTGNIEELFTVFNDGEPNKVKEFHFNQDNTLIRQVSFDSTGELEEIIFEYYESGILNKETVRNTRTNQIREKYYENNKNNNCIKTVEEYTLIENKPEGKTTSTKQRIYLRRITYF